MEPWLWDLIALQWSEALLVDAWVDAREFSVLQIYDNAHIEQLERNLTLVPPSPSPPPPRLRIWLREPPKPKRPPKPPVEPAHYGESMQRPNLPPLATVGVPEVGVPERHVALTLEQWAAVERWNAVDDYDAPLPPVRFRSMNSKRAAATDPV